MKPGLVLLLITIIPATLGLDGECHVHRFCVEEGLSGKNLSIVVGSQNICEITGAPSPCNVTCDEESKVYRLSDNCIALITRCASNGLYLERGEGKSTPPNSSETFSDRKNAIDHVLSNETQNQKYIGTLNPNSTETPNQNDTTPGTNSAWDVWDNYAASIIAVVANLIVFTIGILIQQCKKKRRSSEISSPEEGMELNTVQVTDGTPNGINGHAAHNGISSESSVVGV